jgi:hypothetical protein
MVSCLFESIQEIIRDASHIAEYELKKKKKKSRGNEKIFSCIRT